MTHPPLFTASSIVQAQWIDYNGHMNMGYYLVAFDEIATDGFFDYLGIGEEHKQSNNHSTFTLGSNIDFLKEVFEGDELRFETRLVDYDHKRLHYFHCMYNVDKDYLAATNECLTMYIDMESRRGTSFSEELMASFQLELENGAAAEPIAGVGRKLGIRRQP